LVGKSAAFSGHAEAVVFSNHFIRVRADENRLDFRYLARWLTHQQQQGRFESLCTRWVNQAAVRKGDLLSLSIPLPSLSEQKRIAGILAKADRLRRLRRYARKLSDGYLQSVFLEMFGDPVTNPMGFPIVRFGDICETRLGKMLDAKQQTGENLRPYLRNLNVQWARVDLSDVLEMDFSPRERDILRLRRGDVLICEGGEVGRAAIWNDEVPEMYYQKALHRARPSADLALPEFIVWLMRCQADSGGLTDSTSQATIAHLTGVKLRAMEFPLPRLALQHRFAAIVSHHRVLQAEQREAERQTEYLFQTLLHRAFEGAL
jgi:type I restriction enzyme S subunit